MMGLDIVEMVIEVESAFGIDIPDADAERLRTVGLLYDYVAVWVAPASAADGGGPYEGDLWERYLDVLEHELGVRRSALRPDANFVKDLRLD